MPPKKETGHAGILACDPSFKGMAWAAWSPGLSWKMARCYDIRESRKIYDTPEMICDLVYRHLQKLIDDFPLVLEMDVLVIEGQFKRKMQRLRESVCNQMRMLIGPDLKIIVVTAISWRKHFSVVMPTYTQNKAESVRYLKNNPQLKLSRLWSNNDNICEAILLLNYALERKALRMASNRTKISTGSNKPNCISCGSPPTLAVSNSEKNPDRTYWKCTNGECDKKGFMCWQDDTADYGKPRKRSNAPSKPLPPAKRQAVGESPSSDAASKLFKLILAKLDVLLDRTVILDRMTLPEDTKLETDEVLDERSMEDQWIAD